MFDITEYFEETPKHNSDIGLAGLEDDITFNIDAILGQSAGSIYSKDRFKYQNKIIDILYPKAAYPGRQILMTSDRVRFLLSFYPVKSDFAHVNKIIIMPRYVEIGDIELAALYLRRKKVLVCYLTHPHFYKMNEDEFKGLPRFKPVDLQGFLEINITDDAKSRKVRQDLMVHPLWYFLFRIETSGEDIMDKFLVKRDTVNETICEILRDISRYYARKGY